MFKGGLRRVVAALSVGTMVSAPPPLIPGAFVGSEHHFRARVYFEDTDLSGIVYHANYLRYMERARSDMLRSEEHTSELQSLMRISFSVFCLKKKNRKYTLQQ